MNSSAGVTVSICQTSGSTSLTFDGDGSAVSKVDGGWIWTHEGTALDATTYATERLAILEALAAIAPQETIDSFMIDYDVSIITGVMADISEVLDASIKPTAGNFAILATMLSDLEAIEANAKTLEFE